MFLKNKDLFLFYVGFVFFGGLGINKLFFYLLNIYLWMIEVVGVFMIGDFFLFIVFKKIYLEELYFKKRLSVLWKKNFFVFEVYIVVKFN